ncbi:MAG: DHH family phosphoesterase [Oscillospiraceae bacterium]|jgi:c-di-AMP phosphodiesterase-like protein
MQNRLKLFTPIVAALMLLSATLAGITFFYDRRLFLIYSSMVIVVFIVVLIMLHALNRRMKDLLEEVGDSIRYAMKGAFTELPTPVITVLGGRDIIWYNQLCAQRVFDGREMLGEDIGDLLPGIDFTGSSPPEGYHVTYGNRAYTAFVATVETKEGLASVIYLIDDTNLKYYANEYHESKPSVALLMVDNYDELIQDYKDSERAQLMSEIEQAMEQYIVEHHGFVTKIAKDRFIAIIQTRGVRNMLAGKFELLDKVRNLSAGDRMSATLSIGVAGEADSLYEAEQSARQALDMCLGRGGDQAAVKTANGYEFYGGMSKAIEKRTKVKTRIIANALSELIEGASNVILMGHRFSDLDCMGAAIGMFKAVRSMNKPVHIAIDKQKNLVKPLLEKLLQGGYSEDDFMPPEAALELVNPKTVVIILDTHVPHVVESEAIYRAAKNVVVIDHHRKLVGHIDNAVIFFHEPYASSTSEMVAELLQYFPSRPTLSRVEAEALMSGIMLDTKNFVLRTGVRTFEAAAWLRRMGADTVEVRKMFASSMEAYQQKASFIATAQIYQRCAIAVSDEIFDDIKVVAAQAADELTTIANMDASFVIFLYGEEVNVSARSLGAINVQLIMEKLGGGGHQTMAAAQFANTDVETVRRKVMEAIDEYYAEIRKPVS